MKIDFCGLQAKNVSDCIGGHFHPLPKATVKNKALKLMYLLTAFRTQFFYNHKISFLCSYKHNQNVCHEKNHAKLMLMCFNSYFLCQKKNPLLSGFRLDSWLHENSYWFIYFSSSAFPEKNFPFAFFLSLLVYYIVCLRYCNTFSEALSIFRHKVNRQHVLLLCDKEAEPRKRKGKTGIFPFNLSTRVKLVL